MDVIVLVLISAADVLVLVIVKILTIFLAIDNSERVKVFSINYEGRTPPITKNRSTITSQSYRDRKDAKRELELLAALEGCDVVVNAELVRKETSDSDNPNYIYSVWEYKGLI